MLTLQPKMIISAFCNSLQGRTALMEACCRDDAKIVEILIAAGANVNASNDKVSYVSP